MVLKTTFGQSQRWSLIRGTLGVENEEKNNLNFAIKVFSSPEHEVLMVSYCDQSMSVVRHASSVVRRQQFPLNDYSS